MATDATGTRSVYNTLTSTTVDTVTLQGHWAAVEILNTDPADTLWVTVGTVDVPPGTPSASLNESFEVPPASTLIVEIQNNATVQPQVKILGDGGAYGVIGHPAGTKALRALVGNPA